MKRKLGELLIEAGALTSEDVDVALSDQAAGEPSRLGDLLLSTGKITPAALARALAIQHELPFADLSYVAPEATALVPLEFQRAHKLVAFRLDRDGGATRVHVAVADPTLGDVVEELRSQLKREVIVHVAPIDDVEKVHAALAGEGAEEPVVMGEVLEEEVFLSPPPDMTAEVAFPAGASAEFPFPEASPSAPDNFAFPDPPGGFSDPEATDAFSFAGTGASLDAASAEASWSDPFADPPPASEANPPPSSQPTAPAPAPPPVEAYSFEEPPAVPSSFEAPPFSFEEPPAAAADEFSFEEPPAAPAPASPAVTEEELFGSLDLGAPTEEAPLSTDLADEIGRHDLAPPQQDFSGFSALSAPLGDPTADRFGARASSPDPVQSDPVPLTPELPLTAAPEPTALAPALEPEPLLDAEILAEPALDLPQIVPAPLISPILDVAPVSEESTQKFAGLARIPSFAIPPEVPVEPRRSPVEPLRRPAATLGRIALKRVAVNREGVAVAVPAAVILPPAPPPRPPEPIEAPPRPAELELPEWMRSSSESAAPVAGDVTLKLAALLAQVESGELPTGPALAALLRLLVERGVLDEAALTAALKPR